jgi:hypothetical protein
MEPEVLVTEYPDPLRDDEGKICGTPRRLGDDGAAGACQVE